MDGRKKEVSPRKPCLISPRRDVVFKFLVIGDYGVGKTALVRRYIEGNQYPSNNLSVQFYLVHQHITQIYANAMLICHRDIAGHERFNYMTRVYYKYAVGCLIVFDVTRFSTFTSAKKWLKDIQEKVVLDDGRNIPVILLANKWDIEEHCVEASSISKYCKEAGISNWFQTSAKTNMNINESMLSLISAALEMTKPVIQIPEVIKIHTTRNIEEEPCCR